MVDLQNMTSFLRFLTSKAFLLSLALGFAAVTSTLILWTQKKKPHLPPKPTMTVAILTHEALLNLLRHIRLRYSAAFNQLRAAARIKRRKQPRGSEAYRQCILQFNKKTRALLREVSKTVIRENDMSDALVLASCAFYEGEDEIEDAKANLGKVINDTKLPKSLNLDTAKEIFLYCHDQSSAMMDESFGDFQVRGVALEDELWERFGYEIEEIEKAYERFKRDLQLLDTQIKLQGNYSFTSNRSIDDGSEAM